MNAKWMGMMGAVLFVAGSAYAAGGARTGERAAGHSMSSSITVTPSDVRWGPAPKALPAGAQAAVLDGDPAREGAFAMRLKVPAGYRIAPHTHPRQERVTVISGRFQLGHGRSFDEAKLQNLEAGSFFSLPPGMEHFARAAEDTVLQLNGEGPWAINYVNPADDPRNVGSAGR
jgi:quercetin dioxygenase-like cupin family protein